MPTYVYKNHKTGEVFELQQRITENALTHHPETGDPVSRVIQAAGIVFKGSGFYKTDSRPSEGSSSKAKAETSKAESGTSQTASESKAESPSKTETSSSKTEAPNSAPSPSIPS